MKKLSAEVEAVRRAKAALVAVIGFCAESADESAENKASAWQRYNKRQARVLRELAREVKKLPDTDPRVRRLVDINFAANAVAERLDEILMRPGTHPSDDDPGVPDADGLLDALDDYLDEEAREEDKPQ